MLNKMKLFVAMISLIAYVMTCSGCAPLWFLAGAGTAATAIAVSDQQKGEE